MSACGCDGTSPLCPRSFHRFLETRCCRCESESCAHLRVPTPHADCSVRSPAPPHPPPPLKQKRQRPARPKRPLRLLHCSAPAHSTTQQPAPESHAEAAAAAPGAVPVALSVAVAGVVVAAAVVPDAAASLADCPTCQSPHLAVRRCPPLPRWHPLPPLMRSPRPPRHLAFEHCSHCRCPPSVRQRAPQAQVLHATAMHGKQMPQTNAANAFAGCGCVAERGSDGWCPDKGAYSTLRHLRFVDQPGLR